MTKTDEVYAKAGLVTNVLVVFGCLSLAVTAAAQPPELSKAQRATLQAVVQAVDAAANQPQTPESSWPAHVLRASDGSHYVAFSVDTFGEARLPPGPVVVYVRLATARPADGATATAERSSIGEWLAGQRVDPRMLPGRGIAIGEMPAFGAGAIGVRGSTPSTGSMDLKLMALERERARQEKQDADKQRRAQLEGKATATSGTLPFEDFDIRSQSTSADGHRIISRALTAGPGDYDLFVAWTDPAARRPSEAIHVSRTRVTLPLISSDSLALSSIIVADSISIRATPYTAAEQASHPYSIGLTEIVPAPDAAFTRGERLAVAFQVINARPGETGKPDVAITFRIVRLAGERELPAASLNPQTYTEASLPADFDLRLGHPLLAAMSAPLATLARGDYRLKITATDRRAAVSRTSDADFRITGTPLTLLAEAPPLGRPFERQAVLADEALSAVMQALMPANPSPALRRALAAAAARQFVELLVEEPVPPADQGVRAALTGLALYTIGEASAVAQLQRALTLAAPPGPVQFLMGATRAIQKRDPDAIAAWQVALDHGLPSRVVTPLLVEAHLRRGEAQRAADLIAAELAGRPADGAWVRAVAAAHLATGRDREAVAVLEARLSQDPGDLDARWLLLQALYGSIVRGTNTTTGNRDRFRAVGQQYVADRGANAALAADWLQAVP